MKSITVGYGEVGSLTQDVAAIQSLRELAHEYFQSYGYTDYEFSTVFHQWMGGFPEANESVRYYLLSAVAGMSGATKVITKSRAKTWGIPTAAANVGAESLPPDAQHGRSTEFPPCLQLRLEIELIRARFAQY